MNTNFAALDLVIFIGFFVVVIGLSVWKSRRAKDHVENSSDFFLAGRGLTWPLIGISIVAANISTEQMVGMAGQAAGGVGLAVSAWQLIGSVGIVLIAITLLPRFLRAGIYTMPEFLEYRYNTSARVIMAVLTVVIYVFVLLTAVLYSGGVTLRAVAGMNLVPGGVAGGIDRGDLLNNRRIESHRVGRPGSGSGPARGRFTRVLPRPERGGRLGKVRAHNADKLHMILPANHPDLPWTGIVSGMWIVIVYYCGLNQFIVQRNLAARTLRDGQLGNDLRGRPVADRAVRHRDARPDRATTLRRQTREGG